MNNPLFVAIEAGGTKFNVALGNNPDNILCETQVSTRDPESTLTEVVNFISDAARDFGDITAIGIASFGPIALNKTSSNYGHFLNTPKPGWANTRLLKKFEHQFSCPIGLDTDVNAAALAEHEFWLKENPMKKNSNLVYITVGTGVGVGVCIAGQTLQGELHPELAHLDVTRINEFDSGQCPSHKNCIEGMICGPALEKRWGFKPETAPQEHPMWENAAYYLAQLCSAITLAYAPYKIIIGGGVNNNGFLFAPLFTHFKKIMANYLPQESFPGGLENFIQPPGLNGPSGIAGAFLLASRA